MNDEHRVSIEKADAISKGQDTFDSAVIAVSPVDQINRWLKSAVVVLIITTLMSCAVAITVTVFRTAERRASNRAIESLATSLDSADDLLKCHATASLLSDRAAAELQIAVATEFSSAIDGVDPAPDPVVVARQALALREALDVRQQAIEHCSEGEE